MGTHGRTDEGKHEIGFSQRNMGSGQNPPMPFLQSAVQMSPEAVRIQPRWTPIEIQEADELVLAMNAVARKPR
jgi:hypothetical protein